MNITYYVNEDKKSVIAVGHSRPGYAEGINEAVAEELAFHNVVARKDMLVPQMTRCVAKAHGSDEFDIETGKAIARDKVLAKYCARVEKALAAYKTGLETFVSDAQYRMDFCNDKVRNAEERLEKFD